MRFVVIGVAVVAFGRLVPAAEQPNIVFILADDLGWADVGFHGGNAPTPHLDRLAREGVELTQHYVAPVCTPTRCALLSGRYWTRFGITGPQGSRAFRWDTMTLPRALREVGYETAIVGKWHLGGVPEWGPRKFGFDHSYGSLGGGVGPWNHLFLSGDSNQTWHRDDVFIEEQGHVTDLIAQEAVNWIHSRGDRPFFLYVPFSAVHIPIKEPLEWLARVPATLTGEVPRQYAAAIMHLDDSVGRIVAELDRTGRRGRTLVVFSSDNGGSWADNIDRRYPDDVYAKGRIPGNNTPWRGQKTQLYEGGIRVATFANWPARLTPRKVDSPVHIVDWMPTLCALAGAAPAGDLKWDGRSIWPLLTGESEAEPRTLYWAGPQFRTQALRDGDWKLIVMHAAEGDRAELYDLANDPGESLDLASRMPEKVADLRQKLAQIAQSNGDARVDDGR